MSTECARMPAKVAASITRHFQKRSTSPLSSTHHCGARPAFPGPCGAASLECDDVSVLSLRPPQAESRPRCLPTIVLPTHRLCLSQRTDWCWCVKSNAQPRTGARSRRCTRLKPLAPEGVRCAVLSIRLASRFACDVRLRARASSPPVRVRHCHASREPRAARTRRAPGIQQGR